MHVHAHIRACVLAGGAGWGVWHTLRSWLNVLKSFFPFLLSHAPFIIRTSAAFSLLHQYSIPPLYPLSFSHVDHALLQVLDVPFPARHELHPS